ncbi:hypothetical protein E3Z27_11625 [Pseudomonas mediterranea]|uniref:Uncharacterized protein n=1 Tax=Pseudomonas mediterranea TaxID=183795 RepID=A0AAX2DF91_9PSED|nr:hypothetical protein [Pseudomonas mediterranea]KGU82594.1 hypothetical protein N005_24135 [Pseudomonas mediterranea CFBP 5447]MBL0844238.1 hypothetical protein [Pseudomonas mediterranea]QHA82280.1 hypothetical protein E3Z27_11625 [Pseudomonas mediterranea]UZE03109.1 hypothetical protein LOY71_10955 [Pseudomonas mediterranea]SDU65724.1 hypothetical protein SAMN05216476_4044 [Pseudomonas mediterranea]
MIIRLEERQAEKRWVVHLDAWCIGFRSVDEALAFTRTLQARIDAPHAWPQDVIADRASGVPSNVRSNLAVEPWS